MKLPRLFGTFSSLPLGDQLRLLSGAVLLVSFSIAFAVGSFSRIRRYLLYVASRISPVVPGSPAPEQVIAAVTTADRYVPGYRTCLMRSLSAEVLLRLYDVVPVHYIGVDNTTDEFEAHSWLEYEGRILIGDTVDLSEFETLPPLDEHAV